MSKEIIAKAGMLIGKNTAHGSLEGPESYCVLALIDDNGYPTASTITASKSEGIDWVTFCTGIESNKAMRIASCNRASVCFNKNGQYNITLVGTIEMITDPAVKQEMWYEGLEKHFSGPEAEDYCVLRFKSERYNLFIDWQAAVGVLDK